MTPSHIFRPVPALLGAALCLLPLHAPAQTQGQAPAQGVVQEALSLQDCVNQGIAKHFPILIAEDELAIARNNASLGASDLLPTLGLNASQNADWDRTRTTPHDQGAAQTTPAYYVGGSSVGLYLNWTLFNGMGNRAKLARLQTQLEISELQTVIAVEDYILSMATAYYRYVALRQEIALEADRLALSAERVRIARVKENSGSGSKLETLQARVDFNADSTAYIQAQQALTLQRLELNRLMCRQDLQDRSWEITDTTIHCKTDLDFDALYQMGMDKNTSILVSRQRGLAAKIGIQETRSAFFPTLSFSGGYALQHTLADGGSFRSRQVAGPSLGLSLSLPLFNLKQVQNHKNAKLNYAVGGKKHQDLVIEVGKELHARWLGYQDNLQLSRLQAHNVSVSEANLQAALLQYKQEQLSGLAFREAQNSHLAHRLKLLQLRLQTKLEEISLLYLAGLSTEVQ